MLINLESLSLFMVKIDVNTDSLIKLTAKLENLSRSALPVAVRGTLNNAAFDVKQRTLTKSAEKNFPHLKQKRFFLKLFQVLKRQLDSILIKWNLPLECWT